MKLRRFVLGPERYRVPYEPLREFAGLVRMAAARFMVDYGVWPDACYVSVRFPGPTPGLEFLGAGVPGDVVALRFRRQTLLGMDEVLLGVEVETDLWEGDDEQLFERAIS